jgi:hypothetical protein
MRKLRLAVAAAFGVLLLAGTLQKANAQVSINVNIGHAPACPYGYFNYEPYQCAPFGYYGPQWFQSGIFIGAGPWFAGPVGFRGYYDRHFDPRYGYRGPFPSHDERPDWGRHNGWEKQFHGGYYRTEYRHDNGNHNGEYKEHGNPHGEYHDNGHGHEDEHGNGHGNGNGHGEDHGNGHGHGH